MDALSIKTVTVSKELVIMEMPITNTVKQPMGFLHGGGATVALAETAASIGGLQHIHPNEQSIAGLEINCNHLKAKKEGWIQAKASPIHVGKKTMVWEIKIVDEKEDLLRFHAVHLPLSSFIIHKTEKNRVTR